MGRFKEGSKRDVYVDCDFWLIRHTEKAFLVASDEDAEDQEWIPKAACEFEEDLIPDVLPVVFTLSVKEDMLIKKGFL